MLNEVGRLCVKIAGRDANKICVIVEVLGNNMVLVDGETRRRKCNMLHLEPLSKTVDIKKGASHAEVKKALASLNIEVLETKPKKDVPRQKKVKVNRQGTVEKKVKKGKAQKKEVPAKKADKAEKQAKPDKKEVAKKE
jgi:large subunit ribosomal protein L14e